MSAPPFLESQKPPARVILAFSVSLFALSQAALLVRGANATSEVIGFWRMSFSSLLSMGLLLYRREKIEMEFLKKNWRAILLAGVLFFLHFWIWFHAVARTSIANATLLFCTNPLFTAVGARVFNKEKLSGRLIIALALGLLGLLVMEWKALALSFDKVLGDVLAILAAAFFSGYVLATKRLRETGANLSLAVFFNIICWIGFTGLMIIKGAPFLGYPTVSWICFFGMAVGPSLLGHALFTYSLKYMKASVASVFVLTEPVMAAITANLIFSEQLSNETIYGFLLITIGLVNLVLGNSKRA